MVVWNVNSARRVTLILLILVSLKTAHHLIQRPVTANLLLLFTLLLLLTFQIHLHHVVQVLVSYLDAFVHQIFIDKVVMMAMTFCLEVFINWTWWLESI